MQVKSDPQRRLEVAAKLGWHALDGTACLGNSEDPKTLREHATSDSVVVLSQVKDAVRHLEKSVKDSVHKLALVLSWLFIMLWQSKPLSQYCLSVGTSRY
jgi:hypothetical protein